MLTLPFVPAVGAVVTFTVATLVSFGHGDVPVRIYLNVLVVAVASTVKLLPLNTPPVPVKRVHVPPVCSPVITLNKSITVPDPTQADTLPFVPAFACGDILIVAILVSFGHGDVPVLIYLNVLVVAPADGVYVFPLNVPPVPVNLVHAPPVCSPVMIVNKSIAIVLLSQILTLPSVPALTCADILIVAILVSFGHGDVPVLMYLNVLVVAPAAGVNVFPLNVPPVPVNLVHAPPVCSPVMIVNKSITVVLLSQILTLPSVPALTCGVILIVATLVSFGHGEVPTTIYLNVLVVAPDAGVKLLPVNVPPVPVNLVHAPPVCSPVIKLNKSIVVVELSQIEVLPSVPALPLAMILTVAIEVSFKHGDTPVIIYLKVEVVAPIAGVKLLPKNVPPVPVNLVQVPPVASPVIKLNRSITAIELSQTVVLPLLPAESQALMHAVHMAEPSKSVPANIPGVPG